MLDCTENSGYELVSIHCFSAAISGWHRCKRMVLDRVWPGSAYFSGFYEVQKKLVLEKYLIGILL